MNSSADQDINERDIFLAASEMADQAARDNYLSNVCADDAELRQRIEGLLTAQEAAPEFLEENSARMALTIIADDEINDEGPDAKFAFLKPSEKPGCLGTLDQYEIVGVIGRGAFGIVFRAFDTKLNRIVAIKVMNPELAINRLAVKRFSREAQAAAAVNHDHVITLHAINEASRPPYIVMEYVEGESLEATIERDGALSAIEIVRVGMQIAAGLRAAHSLGMVHRDIKPANILLENGIKRVKITDFGLARAVDDIGMTQTGTIAGTPQYMSPEQGLGKAIDERSDLFSLGSVLYTLCTGRAPFRADSTVATLKRVCDDEPRDICDVNPDVPGWLRDLIMQLLAKEPKDRFQSAEEVEEIFRECLSDMQSKPADSIPKSLSSFGFSKPFKRGERTKARRPLIQLLLFGAMWIQLLAMIGSCIATVVDVETILFTGPVFAVGLGSAIAAIAFIARMPWFYPAFGLSSVVFAALLTTAITVFNWSPNDRGPIISMIVGYSLLAVPWGFYLMRQMQSLHPSASTVRASLESRGTLLWGLAIQLFGIALTAALFPVEEESAVFCIAFFYLVVGATLSAIVLSRRKCHLATKILVVSSPVLALLLAFTSASYNLAGTGTAANAFGIYAILSVVTLYAFVAVPVGLWCLAYESRLFGDVGVPQFSIKTGLIATTLLGLAFAFARPSLNFGSIAFATAALLGVTFFSLAAFFAYVLYRRANNTALPTHWFGIGIATFLLAAGFMFGVSIYDAEKNFGVIFVRVAGLSEVLPEPVTVQVKNVQTQEIKEMLVSTDRAFLGRYRIGGDFELKIIESDKYELSPAKFSFESNQQVILRPKGTKAIPGTSMSTLRFPNGAGASPVVSSTAVEADSVKANSVN